MVVQSLLGFFAEGVPIEEQLKRIVEYFKSSHFSEIPRQWLSARIMATLKDMVKEGAYANRNKVLEKLHGFFLDVEHIATYAPYCDAFIMDKAMASLVSDGRVGLERRYGVKVFSLNNWDQFIEWLDVLESGMSEEHRAGLAAAYP